MRKSLAIVIGLLVMLNAIASPGLASDSASGGSPDIIYCSRLGTHTWLTSNHVYFKGGDYCTSTMGRMRVNVYLQRQWGFWWWQWETTWQCPNPPEAVFVSYRECEGSTDTPNGSSNHRIVVEYTHTYPVGYTPSTPVSGTDTIGSFSYGN